MARRAGAAWLLSCALLAAIVAAARAQAEEDYRSILGLSWAFYEGQQSGELPSWNQLLYAKPGGWKKPAHLDDGKDIGVNLAGGYYDAGDYLKIPHPLAWSVGNLVLAMLEFKSAYQAAGQWEVGVRNIKWAADWLVKAHIKAADSPHDNVFVGQLSGKNDHQYFGRPEHATNARPVYVANASTGGADLVGEYAAAFAAAAVLLRSAGQADYATMLFSHAKQAFSFAEAFPNTWKTPGGVFQAYSSYWPEGYIAHLAWAAAWMCRYDATFCPAADRWMNAALGVNNLRYGLGYDWDSTMPGAAVLVVSLNLSSAAAARQYLEGYFLPKWEDTSSRCPAAPYSTVCYTPKGLAWYSEWGTLRNTGNAMFIAALMGKYGSNRAAHVCWVRSQMRYITGASTGKSYLIGYGPSQPQRPHHRQSACSAKYSEPCRLLNGGTCCAGESGTGPGGCCDEPNFMASHPAQVVLRGGLVGGPDQADYYPDVRNDYRQSEVALDYNAGFTGAAAGLIAFKSAGWLATCNSTGGGGGSGGGGSGGGGNGGGTGGGGSDGGGRANCTRVELWKKCGGMEAACPAGSCGDTQWKGFCCPASAACKRYNEWFWMCVPESRSLTAPEGQVPGASSLAAAPALDSLQLIVPAPVHAGAPLELAATLTRVGQPVAGAEVRFSLSPSTSNADPMVFTGITGPDGTARVTLAAEDTRSAVGSSVVTAVAPDARAAGVKGTIPVASQELLLRWL